MRVTLVLGICSGAFIMVINESGPSVKFNFPPYIACGSGMTYGNVGLYGGRQEPALEPGNTLYS